jgi:peptidoglycan/xylan/chitin deacetylase (PgdA/CDA1 family)
MAALRIIAAACAAATALLVAVPGAVASESTAPSTVVTLTFDDGWREQAAAGKEMTARGMAGTFFISSGQLGYRAFMTSDQLVALEEQGHEIGGQTLSHVSLVDLPLEKAMAEICSDRAALVHLGFDVTSFAYPYGAFDDDVADLPVECGYNSARRASGLYAGGPDCTSCPVAEDPGLSGGRWGIRTPGTFTGPTALDELKERVEAAEQEGGWLPLVFEKICLQACGSDELSLQAFTAFLDWLEGRSSVDVRTVHEVVGGAVDPPVGPLPRQVGALPPFEGTPDEVLEASPDEDEVASSPQGSGGSGGSDIEGSASDAPGFTLLGFGIGQMQVVFAGVFLALFLTLGYRLTTRDRRYE